MGYTVRAVVMHGIAFTGILAAAVIALLGTKGAARARGLALVAVGALLLARSIDVAITVVSLWGVDHLRMSYDAMSSFIDWAVFPLVILEAVGMVLLAFAVVADRTPAADAAGRQPFGLSQPEPSLFGPHPSQRQPYPYPSQPQANPYPSQPQANPYPSQPQPQPNPYPYQPQSQPNPYPPRPPQEPQ